MNEVNSILQLSDEQQMLQKSIRSYMEAKVHPLIRESEKNKVFPFEILKDLLPFGYIGGLLPEEEGGMGLRFAHQAILMQEAGRAWASLRVVLNTMTIVALMLQRYGTPHQKERYLEPLLSGDRKIFLAITEPNHGSDVAGMETRAVKVGNGYRINGSKMYITNGSIADFGIVFAKTNKEAGGKGITAFIVDSEISEYEAHDMEKMFIHSTSTSALFFDAMWVPEENVLGSLGEGLKVSLSGLNFGRLNVAMGCVGLAEAALDASIDYAKQRKQFGRAIGSFQMVQDMIVQMLSLKESAKMLGLKAAAVLDNGERGEVDCSLAKLVATENAFQVANIALQVHGGNGYMEEYPIERYFRDARGFMIPEGTSQIQKLIIGREILGISAIK